MHLMVSWTTIVQHEVVGDTRAVEAVELRYRLELRLLFPFSSAKVNIVVLKHGSLFLAKELIEDVQRLVITDRPGAKRFHGSLKSFEVNVDFASQTVELLKPRDTNLFTGHSCVESILTEFVILGLVPESADGSLDRKHQVFLLV